MGCTAIADGGIRRDEARLIAWVWGWGNPRAKTSFSAGFKALIAAAIPRRFAAGVPIIFQIGRRSGRVLGGGATRSPHPRSMCLLQGGVHERFWQDME
jgi:hypothetical protein